MMNFTDIHIREWGLKKANKTKKKNKFELLN